MGRLVTAWQAFWGILTSTECRQQWLGLRAGERTEPPSREAETSDAEAPESAAASPHPDAVYALVMLQREGRLIDFLQEDIQGYSDAQVGAAVRQIHAGCRQVLEQCFGIEPIQAESEGSTVELPTDFDPRHIRVIGGAGPAPPYTGVLRHRGWRATKVEFPSRHAKLDSTVVCPAEVEV